MWALVCSKGHYSPVDEKSIQVYGWKLQDIPGITVQCQVCGESKIISDGRSKGDATNDKMDKNRL